jgi:hypothetical protein
MSSGCATTQEAASPTGQDSARSGPKPTVSCEQYLALLSEARKQSVVAEYGQGGSCWTGTKQQAQQCDATCSQSINQIIRANLNQHS